MLAGGYWPGKRVQQFLCKGVLRKPMLTGIRVIGLGIWVAIFSMAISALVFRHSTEENATLVFVAIMDFIVIAVVARTLLRRCRKRKG
jgi:hypothetical protein